MTSSVDSDLLRAQDVTKRFRPGVTWGDWLRGRFRRPPVTALDSVSFHLGTGLTGLAGPNGAGKTTLLRAIAGLVTVDSGELHAFGRPVDGGDPNFRRRVGYAVSGERSHFWRLSGLENLTFFSALHGYGRREGYERARELLELVGLGGAAQRAVREYSTGMNQRLSVARGLLGEPDLLLLDEPTRGLDPGSAERLRRLISEELVARRGVSVLWATHDVEEMRSFCPSLVLLHRGKVEVQGDFQTVHEAFGRVFS